MRTEEGLADKPYLRSLLHVFSLISHLISPHLSSLLISSHFVLPFHLHHRQSLFFLIYPFSYQTPYSFPPSVFFITWLQSKGSVMRRARSQLGTPSAEEKSKKTLR